MFREKKTDVPVEAGSDVELNATMPIQDDEQDYPSGVRLALIMLSLYIGIFLVALDKLIISTAIPAITNDFHAANDIGWYGTAYLLCNCAFLPVLGKVYKVFDVKRTLLLSVLVFEIGSAVCGAAPNTIAFILGRAIAGAGAAGVQSGCLVVIVYAVPLAKRPKYQGAVGAVFGISSILGPTLGGAFTSGITWRWCFYINLPLGAIVLAVLYFFLHIPSRPAENDSLKQKLLQLNFEGLIALLPGVVCLCLALQWGGFTYKWNDGRMIALLVMAVVLLAVFALIQVWSSTRALIPPRIVTQRSIASGLLTISCLGAAQTLIVYYLPVWYQAIKGESAVQSGIDLLALTLAMALATMFSGIMTSKIGYYTPFLITGICLASVGSGLLNTLHVDTPIRNLIGFQILIGVGFGLANQAPNMAAQTVLPRDDVSIGVSLMIFGQTLFGAIFIAIGQNVLDGRLANGLRAIVDISSAEIETAGTTGLLAIVPAPQHAAALQVYNAALRLCFRVALIMSSIAIIGGLTMEWRSVKGKGKSSPRVVEKAEDRQESTEESADEECDAKKVDL